MLRGFERATIVDAVERAVGEVFECSPQALMLSAHLLSTHGIGVEEALALAEQLLPVSVGVKISDLGVGQAGDPSSPGFESLMAGLQSSLEPALCAVINARPAGDNFSSTAR